MFVDWQHPLSRGLLSRMLLGDVVNGVPFDAAIQHAGIESGIPLIENGPLSLGPSHLGGQSTLFVAANSNYIQNRTFVFGNSFTVGGWIYKKSSGIQTIIGQGNNTAANATFWLRTGPSTTSGFTFSTSQYITVTTTEQSLNTWHHLLLVYDNFNLFYYVDGAVVSSATSGTIPETAPPSQLWSTIGRLGAYNGEYWDGYLEDIVVYNRALSPKEILWLYSEPYAGLYQFPSTIVGSASSSSPYVPPPHGKNPKPGRGSKPLKYSVSDTSEVADLYRRGVIAPRVRAKFVGGGIKALAGTGRAGGRGRGAVSGALALSSKGRAGGRGRLAPAVLLFQMAAKGLAAARGRLATASYALGLKAKGRAGGRGKATSTLLLALKAKGRAATGGKLAISAQGLRLVGKGLAAGRGKLGALAAAVIALKAKGRAASRAKAGTGGLLSFPLSAKGRAGGFGRITQLPPFGGPIYAFTAYFARRFYLTPPSPTPPKPPSANYRVTQDGSTRITQSGNVRTLLP